MKKKAKVHPDHIYRCMCIAKVNAFVRVGKMEEARAWAGTLVAHLKERGLLP